MFNLKKCLSYQYLNRISLLHQNGTWLLNEIFVADGKKERYISTKVFLSVNQFMNKIQDLKKDLNANSKDLNIYVDSFVFDIRSDLHYFKNFFENSSRPIAKWCRNISFFESIRELNPHSLELGIKITKCGEGYENNFYLFFVPSIIFDFKSYYEEKQEKLNEEIQKAISSFEGKIYPRLLKYIKNFCEDEKWIELFKPFLYRCLFYDGADKQKNFIREVIIESSVEIMPGLPVISGCDVSLGTLQYNSMIGQLTNIFSNAISVFNQEFLLTVNNIECIVVLESDHVYLTDTYEKILETVYKHLPKITEETEAKKPRKKCYIF